MAYSICKLKNISGSQKTIRGQILANNASYTIQDIDRIDWANDDDIVDGIANDIYQIGDSSEWITSHAQQIAHLQDY